jgi:hypothetical protein
MAAFFKYMVVGYPGVPNVADAKFEVNFSRKEKRSTWGERDLRLSSTVRPPKAAEHRTRPHLPPGGGPGGPRFPAHHEVCGRGGHARGHGGQGRGSPPPDSPWRWTRACAHSRRPTTPTAAPRTLARAWASSCRAC